MCRTSEPDDPGTDAEGDEPNGQEALPQLHPTGRHESRFRVMLAVHPKRRPRRGDGRPRVSGVRWAAAPRFGHRSATPVLFGCLQIRRSAAP